MDQAPMLLLTQLWVIHVPELCVLPDGCVIVMSPGYIAALCGVKYTHTNESVIRSTRLEQKISAQAIADVMDHHQNSQVAANVVSQIQQRSNYMTYSTYRKSNGTTLALCYTSDFTRGLFIYYIAFQFSCTFL